MAHVALPTLKTMDDGQSKTSADMFQLTNLDPSRSRDVGEMSVKKGRYAELSVHVAIRASIGHGDTSKPLSHLCGNHRRCLGHEIRPSSAFSVVR
uniref:Uncharacterized protein n=1 Tax=Haemonchus placei TaxID=6290 RepID=A0A0N4X3J7_HAEPC